MLKILNTILKEPDGKRDNFCWKKKLTIITSKLKMFYYIKLTYSN